MVSSIVRDLEHENAFGDTLLLPEGHKKAHHRAQLCFAAIPDLDNIAIWTRSRAPGSLARCRLEHDRTWFWMRREDANEDPAMLPCDIEHDRAAAACFRFLYSHEHAAQLLAVHYDLDDLPCTLAFHRSGFNYLIRDSERLMFMALGDRCALGRSRLAPFIHPVFAEEPSAHQTIAWTAAVWQDLQDLHVEEDEG
mgnify:CR=1 FL=1